MAGKTAGDRHPRPAPGITVGAQRHNGFLQGLGLASGIDAKTTDLATADGGRLRAGHPR